MKNISKILFSFIIGLFFLGISSCNDKSFLTVDHYSILPSDQMFKSDKDALAGLVGCYDYMLPGGDVDGDGNADADGDWGFKPNLFVGGHPTMDTQATGWDKDWNTQNWTAGSSELLSGWKQCYGAISRCNIFLAGLNTSTAITPALKTSLDGQARGIRAFFYMWLAKTFGRVPLLEEGETYLNTPAKARAKDFTEMWNFIITDLKTAADELQWDPYNGEYGRCTKGFALSYLGEAYMWKAYRVPAEAAADYALAAAALKQVIESGKYELNPSFTTLWDPGAVWTKESIWEEVLDEGDSWTGDGRSDGHAWVTYFTACPAVGGWGSLYLSWEWWNSYEQGDKRREASGVEGAVPNIDPAWKSATNYGYNPYLQQSITTASDGSNIASTQHYHFLNGGEPAPAIWSLKYWRTCRADWNAKWGPQQIYYKRYSNVLLDYAECLFRVNPNDPVAWGYVDQIRNRAFGNMEVGKKASLTAKYLPYYQQLASFYESKRNAKDNPTPILVPSSYPLPFNETTVTVPDAKTYYTQVKADKGFSSEVWLVALGQERRKEFNAEWCLTPDLIRSGFMEDHINHNYPKNLGYPNTANADLVQGSWNTYRTFDFDLKKMDMPIPTDELLKNKLCDQNDAYK